MDCPIQLRDTRASDDSEPLCICMCPYPLAFLGQIVKFGNMDPKSQCVLAGAEFVYIGNPNLVYIPILT